VQYVTIISKTETVQLFSCLIKTQDKYETVAITKISTIFTHRGRTLIVDHLIFTPLDHMKAEVIIGTVNFLQRMKMQDKLKRTEKITKFISLF
jgi:hypothetical protein